jgi:T-complex protein 1 subunit eta
LLLGGGAIEMEISKYLRDYSRSIAGKEQMIISALARSFEIIPRQLCENAGFDATDILNKLRQKHSEGHIWFGVDINKEDISDNFTSTVWEPAIVKINSITAASGLLEIKFNNSFFYINIFLFKQKLHVLF